MAGNFPQRLTKITETAASSSASIVFTAGLSNFTTYYIKLRNIIPATDNVSLLLTFSTDGGSAYLATNYKWIAQNCISATSTQTGSDSDSSITIAETLSSTTSRTLNGEIMFFGMNQATYMPKLNFHTVCYNSAPLAIGRIGAGMNTTTTAVNAIKFAMSSGNIASGSIIIYGVNEGGFLY